MFTTIIIIRVGAFCLGAGARAGAGAFGAGAGAFGAGAGAFGAGAFGALTSITIMRGRVLGSGAGAGGGALAAL